MLTGEAMKIREDFRYLENRYKSLSRVVLTERQVYSITIQPTTGISYSQTSNQRMST